VIDAHGDGSSGAAASLCNAARSVRAVPHCHSGCVSTTKQNVSNYSLSVLLVQTSIYITKTKPTLHT